MQSLTLYSYRRCPFAIRVRMVLEEKNISYQLVEENLSHLSAELLSLHPEGRVPLLVHQLKECRQVIYQSSIITEYLEEAFPDFSLMPQGSVERAQVRLWTYWCDQLFKPDLDLYKYELSTLNEVETTELLTRIHGHLSHWDMTLRSSAFLVGGQMTLADIHLFPFARQFVAIKPGFPELEKYTHLSAWLGQMLARPAFKRVMLK